MQGEEVRQLLRKKDAGRIDSYLQKGNPRKQTNYDIINLLQTWTHCLLYYKNVYPASAFSQKQVLGVPTYVASATPLKQYLDEFFQQLNPHLPKINHLQILLLSAEDRLIESNTLYIDDFGSDGEINQMQKDIQFKSFLFDLMASFSKGFRRRSEEITFKLRVGYRMEQMEKSNCIVQRWVKRDQIGFRGTALQSLKLPNLNIIYEVGYQ